MRNRALSLAAVIAAAACGGGGDGGITPPPPPPPESITPGLKVDSAYVQADSRVVLSADPKSDRTAINPSNVSWTIDGLPAGTGFVITAVLKIGANRVCIQVRGAETEATQCANVTYSLPPDPVVSIRVIPVDTADTVLKSSLHLTLSKDSVTATCDIGMDGVCKITTALGSKDTVAYTLEAAPGSPKLYARRVGYLFQPRISRGVVLLVEPLARTLRRGDFAGQTLPFDIIAAYTTGTDFSSFYLRSEDGTGVYRYTSHILPLKAFPLPVAILDSAPGFSQAQHDSIVAAVNQDNRSLGWNAFRLMGPTESVDPRGISNIVVVMNLARCPAGAGACAASSNMADSVFGGNVWIRWEDFWIATVAHELVHILGFGHGCGWQGLMSVNCSLGLSLTLTPKDISYIDAFQQTDFLESRYGAKNTLADSHQGERTLLGFPEDRVRRDP